MSTALDALVRSVPLVDHHCHGVMRDSITRDTFEMLATESDWPDDTCSVFDSQVGLTFRHFCAPLLDLPVNCGGEEYWDRRERLGQDEVTRRLMRSTGIGTFLVDTGFRADAIVTPEELAAVNGARSGHIVRLETVLEDVARESGADTFIEDFDAALADADQWALGYKSVIAYRFGLDFDPDVPTAAEVTAAAGRWLREIDGGAPVRVGDPVLMRHALHRAVALAKPIQFHVGFGDSDIVLPRCDPSRMTEFIRRTRTSGASIMLLHNYPFVREAGFLAHVYPHVYVDTGVILNYTGWRARAVVRESFELTPFHKMVFSSDAFGLPELYCAGAAQWRREVGALFGEWVAEGLMSEADAEKYVTWAAHGNARRVYGLGER
ncbi:MULTISPECIES: amidohydrolase family protein [unclassified Streptomyces]|uniref:amidohydrolase family protein n=1 Tax=unclassified Streptomyces TaxID=2593676 RepID=UPI0022374C80|nr:amidohydrolase family protein [Streptomyces sp. SHP 1-2]MCW5253600.1 amidohydrolase family protein [Streptomyces sp. SHP 1-2]